MIFDPSTSPQLKPWLVRTLEPICDAEPGALAEYILALLKHNVPENEMRKELAIQLEEFLEKECASFIDTLFTVLRTKSYLPYSASSPSSPSFSPENLDNGIPIPLDGLLSPSSSHAPDRNLKRGIENDDRDGQPPAKGPRVNAEGSFTRYANDQNGRPVNRSTGSWVGRRDRPGPNVFPNPAEMFQQGMGIMMSGANPQPHYMNGRRPQAYQPPDQKRGICRDYHNNGYCARGAMCRYSHGDDAVVPGMYPLNAGIPMPFMPMFPGPGNPFGMGGPINAAYDPHEARMDMRPMAGRHQRAPLLPRIQQEDGSQVVQTIKTSGELPVIQDLTPVVHNTEKPTDDSSKLVESLNHSPMLDHQQQDGYNGVTYDSLQPIGMNTHPYMPMDQAMDIDPNASRDTAPRPHVPRSTRGGGRGRGGRGGTFGGEVHSFRPERRNDKTLVVEKIPEDKLSLEGVNEWFKRFGTVTNVAIDAANAKALISFSNHDEAYAAWRSEDAVFNNRFVKIFWHRPMEGHGQVGAKMLAASAPLVANISARESNPQPTATAPAATSARKHSTSSSSINALAAKHQVLEQQITEQKKLMASLETASAEEKKALMIRLRKLGNEMKPPQSTSTDNPAKPSINDHEKKEKERLDKELEMHSASAAAEGEDSTEDLKAKLDSLRAEAASLGIPEGTIKAPHVGGYRPYRSRGRVRGYRGLQRGGPPRGSMKLDLRPKKLLVKGIQEEGVQALRDWYEASGQLELVERMESGDVVVTFKSRAAAEQGLAKGTNISSIGSVQLSWYAEKPPVKASVGSPTMSITSSADGRPEKEATQRQSFNAQSPQGHEEEVVAHGWGEDGDGEDGMGLL